MAAKSSLLVLACLALSPALTAALSIPPLPDLLSAGRLLPHSQKPLRDTLDVWIEREERIALDKLLANVKPGGRNVEGKDKGVVDGTVVASPSTQSPNYWYQCMAHLHGRGGTTARLTIV